MSWMVDVLSISSIVGIWPRYLEPRLLKTSRPHWSLTQKEAHLHPLKIVHLSDLHFHKGLPTRFLNRIADQVMQLAPDLLLFTGDFLCHARLEEEERLCAFLQKLDAPLGAFCVFGNHDYSHYVTRNADGVYSRMQPQSPFRVVGRTLATLASPPKRVPTPSVSEEVGKIGLHEGLCALLEKTPFQLLHNRTVTLPIGLNITGLGDVALGQSLPARAFSGYDPSLPGLILSHNPASLPSLADYPGEWVFLGHTHGEQIHFPWPRWLHRLSHKITSQECGAYTRGRYAMGSKHIYVSRGLGCHQPFRFCSPPEITLLTTLPPKN